MPSAVAAEPDSSEDDAGAPVPGPALNYNMKLPTLGGRQFWGDVVHFRGWRIQQHVYSHHYRLLDPRDDRHAWGSREQCESELERIKEERRLAPLTGRAVILIHGIIRSSKSFARMQSELQRAGYLTVPFDYPSTQIPIPESAKYLREVIESLKGVEQINFVVHSMGGLIVRSHLQQAGEEVDPRLHRMVMLGVPNLGARIANIVQTNPVFRTVFGPAGQQLIEADNGLIASLPTPQFEFAVVAGARGTPDGYNPLIPGDDDGVVTVSSACLPGAVDSLLVECIHSFLPSNDTVITSALRFLDTGFLRPESRREPVIATAPQGGTASDQQTVDPPVAR
ncbi:MAG: alpha/beta fold hydrolase [Planctomycetaceae bacterium]|nr:alpha/beta fold hydrolase [Planctomycetaceae bacterium]